MQAIYGYELSPDMPSRTRVITPVRFNSGLTAGRTLSFPAPTSHSLAWNVEKELNENSNVQVSRVATQCIGSYVTQPECDSDPKEM